MFNDKPGMRFAFILIVTIVVGTLVQILGSWINSNALYLKWPWELASTMTAVLLGIILTVIIGVIFSASRAFSKGGSSKQVDTFNQAFILAPLYMIVIIIAVVWLAELRLNHIAPVIILVLFTAGGTTHLVLPDYFALITEVKSIGEIELAATEVAWRTCFEILIFVGGLALLIGSDWLFSDRSSATFPPAIYVGEAAAGYKIMTITMIAFFLCLLLANLYGDAYRRAFAAHRRAYYELCVGSILVNGAVVLAQSFIVPFTTLYVVGDQKPLSLNAVTLPTLMGQIFIIATRTMISYFERTHLITVGGDTSQSRQSPTKSSAHDIKALLDGAN